MRTQMASIEDLNRTDVATVHQSVPDEQVLAVGVLSRPGSNRAGLATQVSGLSATVMSQTDMNAFIAEASSRQPT